jgi:hypothetical protein
MPGDGADLEAAQAEPGAQPAGEAAGDPLPVDAGTFLALAALREGDAVASAAGMDGAAFLSAFYRDLPRREGPVAVAVEAVLPARGDCARVPPELIDGGSYVATPPGTFVRGDVNGDGEVDVADAWALWECLAAGGPCPEDCWDAADCERRRPGGIGRCPLPPPRRAGRGTAPRSRPACLRSR